MDTSKSLFLVTFSESKFAHESDTTVWRPSIPRHESNTASLGICQGAGACYAMCMTPEPITTTAALSALCQRFAQADFVAIDTEFMREHTYYSDLCLVQLATLDEAAIVDPKAEGLSLDPLLHLLNNEPVLKLVHAAGQDFEIFYNLSGRLPAPAFDTQVAAMAMGMGEQISYQNLVEKMLGISIEKGARFTDWGRRPLEPRQLSYAVGDVTHLAALFPKMLEQLRRKNRGEWLDEEMARLTDPETYSIDPETVWQRIRLPSRKLEVLGRLKAIAAWREREAQRRNLPRGRLLKDETLADLALTPPRNQASLGKVRGVPASWAENEMGAAVMRVLDAAEPLPREEMPDRGDARPLGRRAALVADLLKLLLKIRCDEADVAPKLVCRSDELERLAAGERNGLPILEGWRFTMFGRDALDLVEGRLAFSVRDGQTQLTRLEPEPAQP